MRLWIPAAVAVLAVTAPSGASATETVSCSAADGSDALVEMNVGSGLPAELPNWVRVSEGGATWSTLAIDEGATPASLYQMFDDGRFFAVDLADQPVTEVIVEIRVLKAVEGEVTARAGTLRVAGRSVHPIVCDSGENE